MVAVALATGAPQGTVLKVLDMAGHEVLSQPVASGAENVTLDLSALPAGTYFVTLATPRAPAHRNSSSNDSSPEFEKYKIKTVIR